MTRPGQQVIIPVSGLEFREGGNTIWVHSPDGGTVLRIKVTGKVVSSRCAESPISHFDLMVEGDALVCIGRGVKP